MERSLPLLIALLFVAGCVCSTISAFFPRVAFSSDASAYSVSPGPTLPTSGRSVFDHIIEENGGVLPSDFDHFVPVLRAQLGGLSASFIPRGRSLARKRTNAESPRVVISGRSQSTAKLTSPEQLLNRIESWQFFIGHATKEGSFEVMSYNPEMGRMEFQIVRNYRPGQKPVVEYANRALCMSCHQHAGPIWKGVPWRETDNTNEIARHIIDAQNQNPEHYGLRPNGFLNAEGNSLGQAATIDSNVRVASSVLYMQDIWSHACGGDAAEAIECRRLLLEHYFEDSRRNIYKPPTDVNKAERLEALLQKNWPEAGIAVNYGKIETFNPEEHPPEDSLPAHLDPMTRRPPDYIVSRYGEMHLDQTRISNPFDWRGIVNQMRFLIPSEERTYLLELAQGDQLRLVQALESPAVSSVLGKSTFSKK